MAVVVGLVAVGTPLVVVEGFEGNTLSVIVDLIKFLYSLCIYRVSRRERLRERER